MAAIVGFIILGSLAGLLIVSIGALFGRYRPVLLAATVVAVGAFSWLAVEANTELSRSRQVLAEYRSPAGQEGPDFKLKELLISVDISEKMVPAFAISGVVALAGLVAQTIRLIRRVPRTDS